MYDDDIVGLVTEDGDVICPETGRRRGRLRRRSRRSYRRGGRQGSRRQALGRGRGSQSVSNRAPASLQGRLQASGGRNLVLPLSTYERIDAAASATGSLTGRVEKPIQGEELLLSSPDGLPNWQVTRINVGVTTQQAGNGAMPAEAFGASGTFRSELLFTPASTGQTVQVDVNHIGTVFPARITGQLNGPAAR